MRALNHLRIAFAALACGGCGIITGRDDDTRALVLRDQQIVLRVGDTTSLALTLVGDGPNQSTPAAGFGDLWPSATAITWRSSLNSVVSVSEGGVVTSLAPGRAFVTATTSGLRDSTRVVVLPGAAAERRWSAIGTGTSHTCGLDITGRVFCWGSRWLGETGEGIIRSYASTVSPTPVASSQTFTQLAVGALQTCALNAEGRAFCWGDNAFGQRGTGGSQPSIVPTSVSTTLTFTQLASGATLTCGLTSDGGAACWGLGLRSTDVDRPPDGSRFVLITAGGRHRCGLSTTGTAYCWGANEFGQLGTGSFAGASRPTAVLSRKFVTLSAGNDYTCGVGTDSSAYCWGFGINGRLGTGSSSTVNTPTRVESSEQFVSIDAGTSHTCAITRAGTGYCWGQSFTGALGIGPPVQADPSAPDLTFSSPQRMQSAVQWQAISAGSGDHSCGVDVNAIAYCWGSNKTGSLGIGNLSWASNRTLSLRFVPTPPLTP